MFDHFSFMGWGGVMGLFWIVLVIVIAVLLVNAISSGRGGREQPTARDILDQRYARGEIDRAEYQQRLDDLSKP